MATSQNGWRVQQRSQQGSWKIPGGSLQLRKGDAGVVLQWVAEQFHSRVETLVWPGNWGYAYRPIRGQTSGYSNHASGTAVDLNAPKHPIGTNPSANFSQKQIRACRKIVSESGGVVRWGGDYRGRKDGMHFEINAGAAATKRFANQIRGGSKPAASKPAAKPTKPKPKKTKGAFENMKQYKPLKRTKSQKIKPGKTIPLRLTNKNGYSWAQGNTKAAAVSTRLKLNPKFAPADRLRIRVYRLDKKKGKVVGKKTRYWVHDLTGSAGYTFLQYDWKWHVPNPPKGTKRYLRLEVKNMSKKTVTVHSVNTSRWKG